jgi:hypothetical protein
MRRGTFIGAYCPNRKKVFFFEKKKQKIFAPAPSSPGARVIQLARNRTDKSFLVLFFKKEHTSFLLVRAGLC